MKIYIPIDPKKELPPYDEPIMEHQSSICVPALWEINTEGFHVISSFYDFFNECWHLNLIGYDPMKKGPIWWLKEMEITEEKIRKVFYNNGLSIPNFPNERSYDSNEFKAAIYEIIG